MFTDRIADQQGKAFLAVADDQIINREGGLQDNVFGMGVDFGVVVGNAVISVTGTLAFAGRTFQYPPVLAIAGTRVIVLIGGSPDPCKLPVPFRGFPDHGPARPGR